MDIPVIGRFFGSTTNKIDRTELIMLLTPHVIRNRDQAQQVTEDFKKSLSTVRNELDRMAKERTRLQQQPVEQKPALPGPSSDPLPPPSPPPPVMPPESGAFLAPAQPRLAVSDAALGRTNPNNDPLQTERQEGAQVSSLLILQSKPASENDSRKTTPTQPTYALALASVRATVPKKEVAKLSSPVDRRKTGKVGVDHQWTVQVAALADESDAKVMMQSLRKSGYDAYVITVQAASKTWHRVRIGRFGDPQAADRIKASLSESSPFRRAFVVAN